MQTDNDLGKLGLESGKESDEENQDKSLEWLLDMDLSEPEENLFTISQNEYCDEGLSAYEAEVAGRPLVRGNSGSDDLATYVDEEIVISSDTVHRDIYSASDKGESEESSDANENEIMAIDFSVDRDSGAEELSASVDEGTDILGLSTDDDIGEKFLSIKRVKAQPATAATAIEKSEEHQGAVSVAESAAPDAGVDASIDTAEIFSNVDVLDVPAFVQAADPGEEFAANEGPLGLDEDAFGSVQESNDDHTDLGSVDEYVASMPDLEDDDEFDNYLLGGEHLLEGHSDLDELTVQKTEGVASVDPSPDVSIDYHEDFQAITGYSQDSAVEDTGAIVALIEEISQRVQARLEELGLGGQSVAVDIKFGSDEESIKHCYAEGYDPISAICYELSEPLSSLKSTEQDAVYVRLLGESGEESWNDMFSSDFVPSGSVASGAQSAVDELLDSNDDEEAEAPLLQDGLEEEADQLGGFGEDIFGQDFSSDFDVELGQTDSLVTDIEDIFASLSEPEDGSENIFAEHMAPSAASEREILQPEIVQAEIVQAETLESHIEWDTPVEDVSLTADEEVLFDADLANEEQLASVENVAAIEEPQIVTEEVAAIQEEQVVTEEVTAIQEEQVVAEELSAIQKLQALAENVTATQEEQVVAEDLPAIEEQHALDEDVAAIQEQPVVTEDVLFVQELEQELEALPEDAAAMQEQQDSDEDLAWIDEPVADTQSHECVELPDYSNMAWCIPDTIEFSYTSASNAEIFGEFLDAFIEEGSDEIEKLENTVGEWEKDIAAESFFSEVSRTLHTIKGIAKGVGLQRFGTLIHNFETLLEKLPRPAAGEELMYFRIVNAWLDAVVRGIEFVTEKRVDIASELPMHASEVAATKAALENEGGETTVEEAAATDAPVSAPVKTPTVLSALDKKRDQQLADEGAKVLAAQQSVRMTSEKLDLLLNLASQAQQLGVRASQNTTRSKRSSAELQGRLTSVRTHIGKIADRALLNVNARSGGSNGDMDALEMDQYSELQEAASILREGVEDLSDLVDVVSRQNAIIEALLKQQSSVISSISSSVQSARVVPVSRLMPGLRRIVRTVSSDLGKVVSFKVLNETGALDRDHYARLQVVLEHMVRNALDHGIESQDERLMAGKPPGGRITIDVHKSGGNYIIRLSDDGQGIDADSIRESAYKKGLDVDLNEMSDEEVMRLIFHKGFSTADTLSEISGRGVGMEIVLNELQQIGGEINIESTVGVGTSFEVSIPSNVSVNGALLVAAADESYAIPLNGLIAVDQIPVEKFFGAVEEGTSLRLFDADCEPAYLGTLCQGVGLPDRSIWNNFVPVIIAGSAEHHMAIAIDGLEEALELVVRSLGSQFSTVPGVAGAATTADGEAIVALDLNLLVQSVGSEGIAHVPEIEESENSTLLALVVDDSRTQRMVATSQLDTVGVETITAENGLVAIDLLNGAHRLPDVVLLDVEMPVKDGIETLREIRKSQRYGHLPVIMVTSRTGSKHRALARDAGCNAYMGKPFNFPALIEQISDLTGHELQLS